MKTKWAYKFINLCVDFFTRQSIKETLDFVLSLERQSRINIESYQQNCLEKLLKIAKTTVKYAGYDSNKLEDYPIVTKEDYKKEREKFISNIKPFTFDITSGTTGTPFIFPVSKEMRLMKRVSHQKLLHWFGLDREEREIYFGGRIPGRIRRLYHIIRNKRKIPSRDLHHDRIDSVITFYNKFKPNIVCGYPSSIQNIICEANERNIPLHKPKIFIPHAENLTEKTINCVKRIFPSVPIVNQYWATEANIATMCPKGRLHIDEDTVICEVINVDESGFGDLVITNLYSYCFPIIRYQIHDKVKIANTKCDCGSNTKIIEGLKGREESTIKFKNGNEFLLGDIGIVEELVKNVDVYQLVYYTNTDKVELLYKSTEKLDSKSIDDLTRLFHEEFEMNITITRTKDFVVEKSGKLRMIKQI